MQDHGHATAPTDSKELLNEAVSQAKNAGRNLASKASETAREAKHEARRQLDAQKGEVVRQIGGVNEALRHTAQAVDNPTLGVQLDRLADSVERAAERLEQAEMEDIVAAAEDFSRSQPTLFLSGAFFLGLLASRFLRAHRPEPELLLDPQPGVISTISEVNHDERLLTY
ncbi:MAG: hypothetical protein WC423_13180 [Vulcanimicrobiota bacterium]